MAIIKIVGIAHVQDNGDGSSIAYIFNNKEELLKDFRKYISEEECSDEDLFNEEDPYENGYIDFRVEIEIDTEMGKLVRPICVSGG
jgi:hypothetical protein